MNATLRRSALERHGCRKFKLPELLSTMLHGVAEIAERSRPLASTSRAYGLTVGCANSLLSIQI